MFRAVVVDDELALRTMVVSALTASGRIIVVGEAATADEAVTAVGGHHPDLVVMEVSVPGMDGVTALPLILGVDPEVTVIVHSSSGAWRTDRGSSRQGPQGAS